MVAPRGWVNRAVATVRREYPAAAVEFDVWFADDEACVITSAWLRRGYGEFRFQLFGASHARAWYQSATLAALRRGRLPCRRTNRHPLAGLRPVCMVNGIETAS